MKKNMWKKKIVVKICKTILNFWVCYSQVMHPHTSIQGVVFLCAHNLTTYKIIISEHCGVILFAKFQFLKKLERFNFFQKNVYGYKKIIFQPNFMKIALKVKLFQLYGYVLTKF